jgi:hypothetical protein
MASLVAMTISSAKWNRCLCIMHNPCCCDLSYNSGAVGMNQCCTILDIQFRFDHSWLICMIFIYQTVSPLHKTFVSLKHSLKAQGFYTIHLHDHLKCFSSRSVKCLAELDIFMLLKLQHYQRMPSSGMCSLILSILTMEVIHSSETLVLIRAP